MRFYTEQHQHCCGIDLHARTMYVCILDQDADVLVHRRIRCRRRAFLRLIEPYRDDLVVGTECLFCWYWVADLCVEEEIDFVLGHALYMKAIHGPVHCFDTRSRSVHRNREPRTKRWLVCPSSEPATN